MRTLESTAPLDALRDHVGLGQPAGARGPWHTLEWVSSSGTGIDMCSHVQSRRRGNRRDAADTGKTQWKQAGHSGSRRASAHLEASRMPASSSRASMEEMSAMSYQPGILAPPLQVMGRYRVAATVSASSVSTRSSATRHTVLCSTAAVAFALRCCVQDHGRWQCYAPHRHDLDRRHRF